MSSNYQYNSGLQPYAHSLRKNMTKAEACLWKYVLRARKMRGHMFRRQRPVGNYIADFACLELWLVIKVDGATHLLEEIQIKDVKKEHDLQHAGFTVLRFTDEAVLKSINQVTEAIAQTVVALEELHPPVFGSIGNCPPPAFGHPRQRGRAATINY